MIPKKPAPHLLRGGHRFSEKSLPLFPGAAQHLHSASKTRVNALMVVRCTATRRTASGKSMKAPTCVLRPGTPLLRKSPYGAVIRHNVQAPFGRDLEQSLSFD
jgi:hypothetical protein